MKFRTIVLCLSTLLLAACNETGTPKQGYPPISFKDKSPIALNVLSVEVQEEYQPTLRAPNVEHLFPVTPASAMRGWVNDRLLARGGDKRLVVIIKDASVKEEKLPLTPGMKGMFTNDQEAKYTANAVIELRIYGNRAISEANVEVSAHRVKSMPEKYSAAQRDQVFYAMTKELMGDLNAELEKNIYQYFKNYLIYNPSY